MKGIDMQSIPLPARLTVEHMEPFVQLQDGRISGNFRDVKIGSAFQPIFSLAHRRVVGYEALLRARAADGAGMSPLAVFDMATEGEESVFLDRLCRIVHIRNFMAQPNGASWLFLNINPAVTVYGRLYGAFFADLMNRYGIPPHRIVVEILEGSIQDEGLLAEAVEFFKEQGCLVAIDDFGAGHSNFERIWRIQPHIVKLDRSIITQAATSRSVRRVIPNMANLIHEVGSLALMEGVETEDEALIAIDSDIDFVQGYYFGRPDAQLLPPDHPCKIVDGLCGQSVLAAKNESDAYNKKLHPYMDAFQVFLQQFKGGVEAAAACRGFLGFPDAERCYLLDSEGRQLGENFVPTTSSSLCDLRFRPLADSRNASWARRHYFRRAISQLGQIQVSRPYLSIAGGNMCVTLSVAVFSGKEIVVLCGDMKWND